MSTLRHLLAECLEHMSRVLHDTAESIRPFVTRAEVYEHLARDPDQRGRG